MKQLLFFITFFIFGTTGFGQNLSESVLINAGNTIINQSGSLNWIIGTNLIDMELELALNQSIELTDLQQNEFSVYPTVTKDRVSIKREIPGFEKYSVELMKLSGHSVLISEEFIVCKRLDLSQMAAGVYLIKVLNPNKQTVAIFKIIRE